MSETFAEAAVPVNNRHDLYRVHRAIVSDGTSRYLCVRATLGEGRLDLSPWSLAIPGRGEPYGRYTSSERSFEGGPSLEGYTIELGGGLAWGDITVTRGQIRNSQGIHLPSRRPTDFALQAVADLCNRHFLRPTTYRPEPEGESRTARLRVPRRDLDVCGSGPAGERPIYTDIPSEVLAIAAVRAALAVVRLQDEDVVASFSVFDPIPSPSQPIAPEAS